MAESKMDEPARRAPPKVVWQWKDDSGWKEYDKDTVQQIEYAYQTGKSFLNLSRGYFAKNRNYTVKFNHQKDQHSQQNSRTKNTRYIRRQLIRPKPKRDVRWNPLPEHFNITKGRSLELCVRSITGIDQPLDGSFAIVNAANADLIRGGGVCGAIFKDAGVDSLKSACEKAKDTFVAEKLRYPQCGDALLTHSCDLSKRAKGPDYIVHAIPPNVSAGEDFETLKVAYGNSLKAVDGMVDSIIFCSLGTGVFGCDIAKSAREFCNVLSYYFSAYPESSISKIMMVLFDPFDANEALKQKYIYSQEAKKQFVLIG